MGLREEKEAEGSWPGAGVRDPGGKRTAQDRGRCSSLPRTVSREQWEDDESPWYLSQECNPFLQRWQKMGERMQGTENA